MQNTKQDVICTYFYCSKDKREQVGVCKSKTEETQQFFNEMELKISQLPSQKARDNFLYVKLKREYYWKVRRQTWRPMLQRKRVPGRLKMSFEPSMAEAFVFNLANSIIRKSSSLTFPETEPWLNLRDGVNELRSIVSAIKAKLLDAGERCGTSNFIAWLKKLKDALFDARCLLQRLSMSFVNVELSIGWLISFTLAKMCALIQAVNKRLTSLESELKILFMAGTKQQNKFKIIFMAETRQEGHFFVHNDEEQSVKDYYYFQGRLKVQKDLENMPVDSFSTLWKPDRSGWIEMVKKIDMLKYWEMMAESMETRRMETKASQQILFYIDQIKKQWLQSDPLAIKKEIQEIDRKYKDAVLAEDEAKWRLLLVGEKIEELDRQRSEFYFASRWWEEVLSKFRDLENQLYDEENNKVEYKDFLGLEQALKKTAWGKTPDYLQTIAIRIEKARGKATDVFHIPAQVPVCAAIKEMEDFPVEDLDWDTLKKWGATLNYARKYGFQVGFADSLLKKNLLAYLVIQNLPNSTAKN
ncbi:hypothetical protein Gotri_019881 [Gossypium trilobum]|uniref:Uncharacterized protein n=1 Tax=Gossypium trilobum TaxID=34281 RepID=A0A7J9EEF1_9ROSI|nr:hypothetical protein [Gossypium trilobum]